MMMTKALLQITCPIFFACFIGVVAYGCTGCMSANPERFEKQVKSWVPLGTSASDAERNIKKHGFKCERARFPSGDPWNGPILRCRRENYFLNRVWNVNLFLQDERVVGSFNQVFSNPFGLAQGQ
jgi:hypothetical protein